MCLDAERSMRIADCGGELEDDESVVLTGGLGSRIRIVSRMDWWRQVRDNRERDRVLDMGREVASEFGEQ